MTTPAPSDVQVGDWVRFLKDGRIVVAIVHCVGANTVETHVCTVPLADILEIRRESGR